MSFFYDHRRLLAGVLTQIPYCCLVCAPKMILECRPVIGGMSPHSQVLAAAAS